jgi:hypothetical protein
MTLKYLSSLLLAALSSQALAFQCYLTLAKDSCWTNYDVKVKVINADDNAILTTVDVPKGKQWAREAFECKPGLKLMYEASFLPIIWESEKGNIYMALHYWTLPDKVGPNESAWDIPVCFSSAFSAVPFPPDAKGNCKCDFLDIPPIPPSKPKS